MAIQFGNGIHIPADQDFACIVAELEQQVADGVITRHALDSAVILARGDNSATIYVSEEAFAEAMEREGIEVLD